MLKSNKKPSHWFSESARRLMEILYYRAEGLRNTEPKPATILSQISSA